MEKCKFCQADLAENGTFCPNCGKNNAEEAAVEETIVVEAAVEETTVVELVAEETVVLEQPAAEQTTAEETVPETKEEKKATPGKMALAIAAVVVLAAALIALISTGAKNNKTEAPVASEPAATVAVEETVVATVPADGNPDDVTCKGTYTAADDVAIAEADTVVATMEGAELTNAQLRIYYRSAISSFLNTEYGYYMMMYGALDYTKPLDTQMSAEGNMTWQQFFIQYALENWQLTQSLSMEAKKAGLEMAAEDQEYLSTMRASLEELAATNGLSVEDMLAADFGVGVDYADFEEYQALYLMGNPLYEQKAAAFEATDEELEAYFQENEETYASAGITMDSKLVDVRHILVQVKGGFADTTGAMTHTDEEWAECEAAAQAILDQWLAGDKTEDSFAALANEKSEDPGSSTKGGLYEGVYMGQMVEPFETWCFDETRQYGDYGLVKTSYGYHVMFFVGSEPMWKQHAAADWKNEQINLFLEEVIADYPVDVTYENIFLSNLEMA